MIWSIRSAAMVIACAGLTIPVLAEDSPGASIFRSNCVICHAGDGSGNTAIGKKNKVRDLRSPEAQKATDAELFELISQGKKPMPGFSGRLTDEQIHQVVAYIRQLAKK